MIHTKEETYHDRFIEGADCYSDKTKGVNKWLMRKVEKAGYNEDYLILIKKN